MSSMLESKAYKIEKSFTLNTQWLEYILDRSRL